MSRRKPRGIPAGAFFAGYSSGPALSPASRRDPATGTCCVEGCPRPALYPDVACAEHLAAEHARMIDAEDGLRIAERRDGLRYETREPVCPVSGEPTDKCEHISDDMEVELR